MYILGKEKHLIINKLTVKKEYYWYLEMLQQLLSLSRIYFGNWKKLLDTQKLIYQAIILFEEKVAESSTKEDKFMYKQLRAIAKSITDGILWRETGYNRVYLSMLSYAKWPWDIKEDIQNTIKKIEKDYLSDDQIVLINDISNFIRIWDYLVIKNWKIIDILESKKNGKKIRWIEDYRKLKLSKQSSKIVETFDYLHNHPTRNISIKTNYFSELQHCIETSYKEWHCITRLNKNTFVRVIYNQKLERVEDLTKETTKMKKIISEKENDEIMVMSNYDFYVNKNNRYATSVIAPYSIFPFDNMTCIYLMSWVLQVVTYVNISWIKRSFKKDGWSIEETRDNDVEMERKIDDTNASNMFYENEVDMSLFKIRKNDWYYSTFSINELQFIALEFKSYKDLITNHNEQYEEAKKKDRVTREYLVTVDSDKEIFL